MIDVGVGEDDGIDRGGFKGKGTVALVGLRPPSLKEPAIQKNARPIDGYKAVAIAATLIFVLSSVCTPPMGALAERVGWNAFWLVCAGLSTAGALVAFTLPRGRASV